MSMYDYQSVDFSGLRHVEQLSVDNADYQSYLEKVKSQQSGGLTDAQKQRRSIMRRNPEVFKRFKKCYEHYMTHPASLRSKKNRTRRSMKYVRVLGEFETKYGTKTRLESPVFLKSVINQEFGWSSVHADSGEGDLTEFDADKKGAVLQHLESQDFDIYYDDEPAGEVAADHLALWNLQRDMSEIDNQHLAMKFAWTVIEESRVDEDWNTNRVRAFLNDLNAHKAPDLPSSGNNGRAYRFENSVREKLQNHYETAERVFKIYSDDVRYKEADALILPSQTCPGPVVVEIFTNRDSEQKRQQVRDYAQLWRESSNFSSRGFSGIGKLLVTTGRRRDDLRSKVHEACRNNSEVVKAHVSEDLE